MDAAGARAGARVGPHVSRYHADPTSSPSLTAHIEAARAAAEHEAGFAVTAAAVFVGGPHNRQIILGDDEARELRAYVARTGMRVVAHSAYSASSWARGDPDAARFIREEAAVCQAAGIVGLVVHLPKAPPATVMRYLGRLADPGAPDVRIYLETPAVVPGETHYETPEKLAALFREIRAVLDPDLARFGLCVDTAHLWTSGIDLRTYADANAWLARLEQVHDSIPHDRIILHLNDSLRAIGTGPDAHAGLALGRIWGRYLGRMGESGLAAFVDYAQRHGTVCILERKPKEALVNDYRILRELV